MTRVKRGNVARKRRQKVLRMARGFRGSSSALFRVANQHVLKALTNSSRDRFQRKRELRSLWITRINAATRGAGINYNQFVYSLRESKTTLNRKILAQLAICDQSAFQQLLALAKEPN